MRTNPRTELQNRYIGGNKDDITMEHISLRDLYEHPLVAEIIEENRKLRELSQKPEVKDLREVPLPYTVKSHILIKEGVHNGVFYPAQMLRFAVDQHEGLQVFLDHQDTKGQAALTWIGAIHNPRWSEKDKAIIGDIDIVDPKYAMAIAYGAKFGLSATVDVDIQQLDGKDVASNPIFKSYSMVVDPAVRETMLNESQSQSQSQSDSQAHEVEEPTQKMTPQELDFKADLEPALPKLDDAIRRASSMRDTSLLTTLQQIKAIVSKVCGKEYPYPTPPPSEKLSELEAKIAALEHIIATSQPTSEPSTPPATATAPQGNAELEAVLKENEKLKEQLSAFEREKLTERVNSILNKELELGLTSAAESETRRAELEKMDSSALDAVEFNLDRTIKILESNDDNSKPAETTPSAPRKQELSKSGTSRSSSPSSSSSARLLSMMIEEQSKASMPYGGA